MALAVPAPQFLNSVQATLQYTVEIGPIADAWLTRWAQQNIANIRPHADNGHSLIFLVPAHSEGCTTQLNVEYHFTHGSVAEFDADADEVRAALYIGSVTPFTAAGCDSSFTTAPE